MTIEELRGNIKWWESKRWIFNLAVGLAGVIAIYYATSYSTFIWYRTDVLGIIIWGIGANILYSSGTLIELFDWYYLKNAIRLKNLRGLFFVVGTVFSCLWTFYNAWMYFAAPHLW